MVSSEGVTKAVVAFSSLRPGEMRPQIGRLAHHRESHWAPVITLTVLDAKDEHVTNTEWLRVGTAH